VKAIATAVLSLVGVAGVFGLAEVTQNRPDAVRPGSHTVVAFDVGTRHYRGGDDGAAQALWSVCVATVPGETTTLVTDADGRFRVTVTPAIGEHGRKRLAGCLEDGTLDRVSGHVRSITDTGV
jgi:hypothetical protein